MIREAEALKVAIATYAEARAQRDELEIDLAIAKRSGDEDLIRAAKKALDESGWYEAYNARKDAALLLCKALDIRPEDMKSAIY